MKIEEIQTKRLSIRGFTKDDALWAYSIWNDPEMGQFLPDAAMKEIDPAYLAMLESLGEDEECCYLIPVRAETRERVGTCSFMVNEDGTVYDIAYCVHKSFWGQGIATEIAKGLIDYAKRNGAKRVTIVVSEGNIASRRVAEKCGGIVIGESTYKKRGSDIVMKDVTYAIDL